MMMRFMESNVQLFLLLCAIHFIADFPLQGDWLASQKGKSWEIMLYHCLIYSGTFLLFAPIQPIWVALIFITHLIIDPLKARYQIVKHIWQDQLLHIAVLAFVAFIVRTNG